MYSQLLNYLQTFITSRYLLAVLVFAAVIIILYLIQKIILGRLRKLAERTKTDLDDAVIEILIKVRPPFYIVVALYLGAHFLSLPALWDRVIYILFLIGIIYEAIQALKRISYFLVYRALKKNGDEKQAHSSAQTFNIIIQVALWTLGILTILSNLGINVTSLIAGLGIGGIAVALALQKIFSDIFSSFSILVDKPFQVGDFIKIGQDMGTVERIGIKTTRLRTLDGQVLVIANQELTTARLENFQRLQKRRALFTLGLLYESKKELLEKVPGLVKEIVEEQELTEFERCHFKSFGDFSLNFEVSFYVKTKDYLTYLNILEKVNLEILSRFKEAGLDFAYPTSLQYNKNI